MHRRKDLIQATRDSLIPSGVIKQDDSLLVLEDEVDGVVPEAFWVEGKKHVFEVMAGDFKLIAR